jgi:outer membrane receptor protein involved in Fe transport
MSIASTLKYTASAIVLSMLAGTASAQAPSGGIDEIVVTAQKREQSLQDVPIVVTAVSAQLLQDSGVKDIKDLTILTPGLLVTSTANETSTTARIRGVGTVGDNAGLESSVGVVVDGVYRPRNGVGFGDLGEMQRIEVLKGPQGTLFGKNTSAGVINILTKQPTFTFGANGELTVGNYGTIGASASVNGPIVADKVAGRLFVTKRQRDGFYDIKVGKGPRTSTEDQTQDFWSTRGQLLFTPSDSVDIKLIGDYTKRDESCCVGVQVKNGATAPLVAGLAGTSGGLANPVNPWARLAYANRGSEQKITDQGLSAEINWKTPYLNGAKLTSITAARDWDYIAGQDADFTTADVIYRPANGDHGNQFKQFSQELRLAGEADKVNWLVGAFYAKEDLTSKSSLRYGSDFESFLSGLFSGLPLPAITGRTAGTIYAAGAGNRDVYKQEGTSWALFTNNSIQVTEKFELTLGLRYTKDEKTLDAKYANTDNGVGCAAITTWANAAPSATRAAVAGASCQAFASPKYNGLTNNRSRSEDAWSGTVKGAYRFNPELLTYASYTRGFKAGGYNLDRVANPFALATSATAATSLQPVLDTSFNGEFVDSYELGVKSTLLDRTLLLNATVFNQKFTDFQLNAFNGLFFQVQSVPEVTSKGVDTDVIWKASQDLTFQGGVTYSDTSYANAKNKALLGGAASTARLPGARLSLAPLWSASASVTYQQPIGNLMGRANLGAKYSSSYNTGSDLNPVKAQQGYVVTNGRLSLGSADDRWAVEVWAQNMLDQKYYQVVYDAQFQSGSFDAFLGQPRTYGLTLRAKY